MAKLELAGWAGGISGRMGSTVFVRTPQGTVMRELPIRRPRATPAQAAVRERMRRASVAFRALSPEEADKWQEYARERQPFGPEGGPTPAPGAQQIFIALATKVLQIDPNAQIPKQPPATEFLGDAPTFAIERTAEGVRITADRPNAPGTLTEILLQPLASPRRRTYAERYRTALFTDFTVEPSIVLPFRGEACGVAVRFVRRATGQTTPLTQLGVV